MPIYDVESTWTIRISATVEADTLEGAKSQAYELEKPDLPECSDGWYIDMDSDPDHPAVTLDENIDEYEYDDEE